MIWYLILFIAGVVFIGILLAAIARRNKTERMGEMQDDYFGIDEKADVRRNTVFGGSRDTDLHRSPYGPMMPRHVDDEESDARHS
jgi:hypothetical protein